MDKIEEVKKYLQQVKWLDETINAKIEQVARLRSQATQITTTLKHDKSFTNGGGDKVSDSVIKIIELENEIDNTVDKLVNLKREIMQKIENVENEDYRLLLMLRYLNFYSWERIAETMNYSIANVYILHNKALEMVEYP